MDSKYLNKVLESFETLDPYMFKDIDTDEKPITFRNIFESKSIETELRSKFPNVRFVLTVKNDYIILNIFVVPEKLRGNGIAREFLSYLIELAKRNKKDIFLSSTDLYGGDKNRLNKFYKSLGFIENNDKRTDEDLVYYYKGSK